MIQIHVLLPDHLHPQTAADRESMAGSMADWVRDHGDGMATAAFCEQHPGVPFKSITFRGLASVAVPREPGEPIPASATEFERMALRKRTLRWRATYLVETTSDRPAPAPVDVGEIVRRGGKLD